MSRIDDPGSFDPWLKEKSEKEKLKEEVRAGVMKEIKQRKRNKTLACSLIIVVLIILISSLIAAALAKSGLVEVPLFSKIFSNRAVPQKVVTLTPEELKNFETDITEKLKTQVKPQIKPGATEQQVDVTLEFTEKELTAIAKSLETSGNSPLKNSQVSVTPEAIEIFGEIDNLRSTTIAVAFRPEITDSELKINLEKVTLGTLSLPMFWGEFFAEKYLNQQIDAAGENIRKMGQLKEITLEDGKLKVRGLVDVLVLMQ